MKKLCLILACMLITASLAAADLPYDEKADAHAELTRALVQAHDSKKKVLAVFGANWCPDCRRLDSAIYDNRGTLGGEKYVIVKVDVGNFDKNLQLARSYGNPIKKGIPGAVILTSDQQIVYTGPLSDLITPHQRMIKIALYGAAAFGILLAIAGILIFLRRRVFQTDPAT